MQIALKLRLVLIWVLFALLERILCMLNGTEVWNDEVFFFMILKESCAAFI